MGDNLDLLHMSYFEFVLQRRALTNFEKLYIRCFKRVRAKNKLAKNNSLT